MKLNRILKKILIGRSLKATFWRALIITALAFFVFKYWLLPVKIQGRSMEPTYSDGSFSLINLLSYNCSEPGRFDVVAIKMAGSRVMLLKRIVGLPGETVAFDKGRLIINGKTMSEEHIRHRGDWQMQEVKVGKNEYFVAGDNRSLPINQHVMGRVDKTKIAGRPLF